MKKKARVPGRRSATFLYVSPWLMVGAVAVLCVIVIAFAVNNLQREKRLLVSNLLQKGQTVVRFVGAGVRASMMMGMRMRLRGQFSRSQRIAHLQQLIDQATVEADIHFIEVIDATQNIIAASDHEKVGTRSGEDIAARLPSEIALERIDAIYRVSRTMAGGKVFEVLAPFDMFPPHIRMMDHMMLDDAQFPPAPLFIIVGLDMKDLDDAVRRHRYHIVVLSITLLLVGIGGWFSVLAFQGNRISRESLRQVKAFTGHLISRLPVGIVATDQHGVVRTFNDAAVALTGIEAHDALDRTPATVMSGRLASLFSETLPGGTDGIEEEMFLDGGTAAPRHVNAFVADVFEEDGTMVGRVLLLYDLTELKRLEMLVRRRDRLAALGKMAAGVAHEIRNPLSSIKGFATLLGSKFSRDSNEKKTADLLVSEVERLNRSVAELLDYTRPTPLSRQDVSLAVLVEDSLTLIQTDARAAGVSVSLAVDPIVRQNTVRIDRDRVSQVLLNIYLNSLQAMEQGGKLSVDLTVAAASFVIRVSDTGEGITPDELEKVTDPYYTTKADGTGLGLSIVRKIIEEHGGDFTIESVVGQGTTVTISLPVIGGSEQKHA